MFKCIIEIFLVVMLFRFLFRYVVPIFRFTAQTSGRMRQMQDQVREMERRANDTVAKSSEKKVGDYIDYEEA